MCIRDSIWAGVLSCYQDKNTADNPELWDVIDAVNWLGALAQQEASIERQLSNIKAEGKKIALELLTVIINTHKYLIWQGQTIRGRKKFERTFMELLKVRSEDKPCLRQ